jgi:hypothetical protein
VRLRAIGYVTQEIVAGRMTVAFLSRSSDKGDAWGDSTMAAGVVPECPAPALRWSQCVAAVRGSRFWALAGDSSDEDDVVSTPGSPGSPLRPTPATVSDFVSEALANLSASFVRAGRRKRSASGGRGPRWLSLPSTGECRRQASVPRPCWPCGSSAGVVRTVSLLSAPVSPSPPPPASSSMPSCPAPVAAPDPVLPAAAAPDPSPVLAPPSQRQEALGGPPLHPSVLWAAPVFAPAQKARPRPRGGIYNWVWKPVGANSASLGFLATIAYIQRGPRSRSRPSPSTSTLPRASPPFMDRDREPRYARRRSFAEVSEADREYELSMRRKALDNDDRCRREHERPRSPQW